MSAPDLYLEGIREKARADACETALVRARERCGILARELDACETALVRARDRCGILARADACETALVRARERCGILARELEDIANAKWEHFNNGEEFFAWAQNRARWALNHQGRAS